MSNAKQVKCNLCKDEQEICTGCIKNVSKHLTEFEKIEKQFGTVKCEEIIDCPNCVDESTTFEQHQEDEGFQQDDVDALQILLTKSIQEHIDSEKKVNMRMLEYEKQLKSLNRKYIDLGEKYDKLLDKIGS